MADATSMTEKLIGLIPTVGLGALFMIVLIVSLIGAALLIAKKMKYNIRVTVFEQVGGSFKRVEDKAMIVSALEKKELCLWKYNKKTEAVADKYYLPEGNTKRLYLVLANGVFTPIEINMEGLTQFDPKVGARERWTFDKMHETFEKYDKKSWFEKYAAIIVSTSVLVTGVFLLLGLIFVSNSFGEVAEALGGLSLKDITFKCATQQTLASDVAPMILFLPVRLFRKKPL